MECAHVAPFVAAYAVYVSRILQMEENLARTDINSGTALSLRPLGSPSKTSVNCWSRFCSEAFRISTLWDRPLLKLPIISFVPRERRLLKRIDYPFRVPLEVQEAGRILVLV
eukprot:500217-Amphidinium_carterae.2